MALEFYIIEIIYQSSMEVILMISNYKDLLGYQWAKRVSEGKEISNKWVLLRKAKDILLD